MAPEIGKLIFKPSPVVFNGVEVWQTGQKEDPLFFSHTYAITFSFRSNVYALAISFLYD
jgi:hypothetical protein